MSKLLHALRPLARSASSFALYGLIGFLATGALHDHVYELHPVKGSSMSPALSPTYHETGAKDRLGVWKWMPCQSLRRGDVVVFWQPHNPEEQSVKRVVALSGDTVYPMQKRGDEKAKVYPFKKVMVPYGHIWVEGDNWRKTVDSNDFGPISMSLVAGRAAQIVWPYHRVGSIPEKRENQRTRVVEAREEADMPLALRN